MLFKRITVNDILEAYRETGLGVLTRSDKIQSLNRACPLVAFALYCSGKSIPCYFFPSYLMGFRAGVDAIPYNIIDSITCIGYQDGTAVREALKSELLKMPMCVASDSHVAEIVGEAIFNHEEYFLVKYYNNGMPVFAHWSKEKYRVVYTPQW